jgi:hypothetical protein
MRQRFGGFSVYGAVPESGRWLGVGGEPLLLGSLQKHGHTLVQGSRGSPQGEGIGYSSPMNDFLQTEAEKEGGTDYDEHLRTGRPLLHCPGMLRERIHPMGQAQRSSVYGGWRGTRAKRGSFPSLWVPARASGGLRGIRGSLFLAQQGCGVPYWPPLASQVSLQPRGRGSAEPCLKKEGLRAPLALS